MWIREVSQDSKTNNPKDVKYSTVFKTCSVQHQCLFHKLKLSFPQTAAPNILRSAVILSHRNSSIQGAVVISIVRFLRWEGAQARKGEERTMIGNEHV